MIDNQHYLNVLYGLVGSNLNFTFSNVSFIGSGTHVRLSVGLLVGFSFGVGLSYFSKKAFNFFIS